MDYAEHELIRRGCIGVGCGVSGIGALSQGELDAQWTTGVDKVPHEAALALRAQVDAMGGPGKLSAAAQANVARWDAYVAKLGAVSKLTPQQFAQYQAQGKYDAATGTVSLTGGGSGKTLLGEITSGNFSGLLSGAKNLFGGLFGGGSAPAPAGGLPPPGQQSGGFLEFILSPVGVIVSVTVAGATYYFWPKKKKG